MLEDPATHVSIVGLETIRPLEAALSEISGSPEALESKKAVLMASQRWFELVY